MRLLTLFLLLGLSRCLAQTTSSVGVSISLPSIALLDIAPNNSGITFNVTAPTEAGNPAATTFTNNSKWLNFTSAVAAGVSRNVRVQVSGAIPNGMTLSLTTSPYSGSGAGARGTPVSPIVLSTAPQTIVSGIGGAFTGDGSNNGYNLTYSLSVANYALIRNQSSTFTIIYSFIDN